MAYEKPICECGNELIFHEQVVFTRQYKINKSGKPRKRHFYFIEEGRLNNSRLKCETCGSEYDYDEDYKDRLIRDDLMNS